MLPRWFKAFYSDEAWFMIGLDGIKIQRVSRQLLRSKTTVDQVEMIHFPRNLNLGKGDTSDLNILGEHFKQVYKQPICQNAKTKVVLSNDFVYYTVVPWNKELSNQEERQAFVQYCFVQHFGDAIKHWSMQVSPLRYGKASLASAVNPDLVSKINHLFQQFGHSTPAIYPHFMMAINHVFDEIKSEQSLSNLSKSSHFWFVHIAQKRLCIGLYTEGDWRVVKSMMAERDVVSQIKTIIHRELVHHHLPAALPVLIQCADPEMNSTFRTLRAPFVLLSGSHFDMPSHYNQPTGKDWVLE